MKKPKQIKQLEKDIEDQEKELAEQDWEEYLDTLKEEEIEHGRKSP